MKKRFIGFTTVSGMLIACWLSPQPINAQAIAFAQNTIRTEKTTTSVKTVQLKDAILSLKAQYNVDILFEEKNIKNLSVPTNSLNNTKNIEDALETLLKPNGLKFKKMSKNTYLVLGKKQSLGLQENIKNTEGTPIPSNTSQDIAIKEVSVSSPSITKVADRTVSGKVVDENNNPLPGTSVTIKGSNRGTSTNAAGEYSLSIPEEGNAILVASFIGYKSQEIMVGKRTSINISMSPNDGSLDEVVVIGYGTQKKKDLTGSATVITSKDFNKGNLSSPDQLVVGKIAGVQVTSNGGSPGAGSTIRIRGGASLNANNDPLIVVDGLPLDNNLIKGAGSALSLINPNDIETFNVLKDASATAIYGSRGSNGVILITTKKGTYGSKLKFNFSTQASLARITNKVDLLNATEYTDFVNANANSDYKSRLGKSSTDWQDLIYRDALSIDNNLTATGSVAKIPFRVSVGYINQNGVLLKSNMGRTSASVGLSPVLLDKHLKVDFNLKGSNIDNVFGNTDAINAAVAFDPTQPVYGTDAKKYNGYHEWTNNDGSPNTNAPRNPLGLINSVDDKSNVKRVLGNLQLDYKFHALPNLRANLNLGMDYSKSDGSKITDPASAILFSSNGEVKKYTESKTNKLLDFYLNYTSDLKSIKSKIDVMLGHGYQSFDSESTDDVKRGTDPAETKNPYRSKNVLISYFGRFNYTLKDIYLLTFTYRTDGSSRFSKDNRWGVFPSAALAIKLNEMSFLKKSKLFSDLRLRAGYGQTGQQDIGDIYASLARYTRSLDNAKYQIGSDFYNTLRPDSYNPNIKWETTTGINLGLDFGFKKGLVSGSVDYYNKLTSDLLSVTPIPAGANFKNELLSNVGSLRNKGVEVSLNINPINTSKVEWSIGSNVTFNESKIEKITLNADPSFKGIQVGGIDGGAGNTVQIQAEGVNPYSFYLFKQIYNSSNPSQPIDKVYLDNNGDGEITVADLIIDKSPAPKVFFGFNSQLRVNRLNFGFSLRGNIDNYVYNNVRSLRANYANAFGVNNYLANLERNVLETNFKDGRYDSNYYIENGSFLRMENMTLGYDLKELLGKNTSFRLNATVQNVFVITKYTGLNPEVASQGTAIDPNGFQGIDNKIYPTPRTFTLGLNLNF